MSTVDRYWSFKLVLQQSESAEESSAVSASPMTVPFIGRQSRLNIPASGSEYEREEVHDSRVETPVAEETPRPKFVYPSNEELDGMTIDELRKFRRKLALQVHPDRNLVSDWEKQSHVMARCNRLIDDAIGRKT